MEELRTNQTALRINQRKKCGAKWSSKSCQEFLADTCVMERGGEALGAARSPAISAHFTGLSTPRKNCGQRNGSTSYSRETLEPEKRKVNKRDLNSGEIFMPKVRISMESQ